MDAYVKYCLKRNISVTLSFNDKTYDYNSLTQFSEFYEMAARAEDFSGLGIDYVKEQYDFLNVIFLVDNLNAHITKIILDCQEFGHRVSLGCITDEKDHFVKTLEAEGVRLITSFEKTG